MIYRLSNGIDWASESFDAQDIEDFRKRVIDILITYHTDENAEYNRRRYKQLIRKYIEKQITGVPIERFHDSYMGMIAKCNNHKSPLRVQFCDKYNCWFVPSPYTGSTQIDNISDIPQVWEILQKGIKHFNQLCAFCDYVSKWLTEEDEREGES
jgi:hypothetical protein